MSETENQVVVEPASEEKTETKEVKATKRATEVSISYWKLSHSNWLSRRSRLIRIILLTNIHHRLHRVLFILGVAARRANSSKLSTHSLSLSLTLISIPSHSFSPATPRSSTLFFSMIQEASKNIWEWKKCSTFSPHFIQQKNFSAFSLYSVLFHSNSKTPKPKLSWNFSFFFRR